MNTKIEIDKQKQAENIAEQWIRLCLMHFEHKKRLRKEKKNGKQNEN